MARFRVLCSLGLGGEAIMPALVDALHKLIPWHVAAFFWVDPQGRILNIFDGGAVDRKILSIYASEFSKHARTAYGCGFANAVRTMAGVQELPDWGNGFFSTDFYNLIWRSFGAHQAIQAIIREGSKPARGALVLYRTAQGKTFSADEKRLLENLIPYIAHALEQPRMPTNPVLEPTDDRGLVILDQSGKLRYRCPAAQRLLTQIGYPTIGHLTSERDEVGTPARQILAGLAQRLVAIFNGHTAAPPVENADTPWGRFVLRAYWLDASEEAVSGCIGVTIERHEPFVVQMWRRTAGLPLSPTQQEVCLLLAQGMTRAEIARRLHIGESTAIDHVRKLYDKLGVSGRSEMLTLLRAQPSAN